MVLVLGHWLSLVLVSMEAVLLLAVLLLKAHIMAVAVAEAHILLVLSMRAELHLILLAVAAVVVGQNRLQTYYSNQQLVVVRAFRMERGRLEHLTHQPQRLAGQEHKLVLVAVVVVQQLLPTALLVVQEHSPEVVVVAVVLPAQVF
jgi:hypothetical protein